MYLCLLQCGELVREANFMAHEAAGENEQHEDDKTSSMGACSTCDDDSAWEVPTAPEPANTRHAVQNKKDSRLWNTVVALLRRLCGGSSETQPLDTMRQQPPNEEPANKHDKHDKQPFVLPRLWSSLKASAKYEARVAEVAAFNAQSRWHFKGLAMTPCRYPMAPLAQPAAVSVYRDGSVVVAHAGVELGQGLSTKVKQVAMYELSTLLADGTTVPWECVRTADNSSELLPNGPCTGGALFCDHT